MASDTHYDIIIIGTGAGGAPWHMRLHHPASASSSSNAATTCVVKRENWSSRAVNVDALSHAGSVAGQGRQGAPSARNYYVGGNTSSTAPPSSGCARRLPDSPSRWRMSARPISYEDLEPCTLAPNAYATCTVYAARIRLSLRPGTVSVSSRQPRAAHSGIERPFRQPGAATLSCAARHPSGRNESDGSRCIGAIRVTGSPAWFTPSQMRK